MAFWNFKRGQSSNLDSTPVVDGTIRFTKDNSKLYVDDGETRKAINPNPDWNASSGNSAILNKPTNLSDFTNDLDIDSKYRIYSITFVTSSNTYPQYPYACTISYTGIDATTNVDINIDPSDYAGNYAIESDTNSLTIYFGTQPTLPLTVKVWLQKATSLIQS